MAGFRSTRFVAVTALLATLLTASPALAASTRDQRLAETRRELRAARSRLAGLVRDDRALLAVIGSMSSQLSRTRTSLYRARLELSQIRLGIAAEERRLAQLTEARRRRAAAIDARVRQLYILGPGFKFESLLTSDTYDEFIARTSTLNYVVRADRTMIQDMARLRDRVQKSRTALIRERATANRVKSSIAEREALQSDLLGTKVAAERRLSVKVRAELEEVRALEREQARILSLIRSRQTVSTGPVSRRGFAWPIRNRINSRYGPRNGGFHTGVDIECKTGQTIGASKAGKVIASEWGGGYGRMIVIDHGNGVSTLYAHMSRLYVGRGARVAQKQAIGACGATGNASGDHLHFEVRINGRHTNPMRFLP